MSDISDSQDVAESLDPEVLSDYDDPTGILEYPPDRPLGVEEYGVTAAEQRVDEPLEERVRREIDDSSAETNQHRDVGRLVAPGGDDPILADDEAQAVALDFDEPDLSAEEAAMHLD